MINSVVFAGPGYVKDNKKDKKGNKRVASLFNRNIEFTKGINILFGDNACGKTTILKALAANTLTDDGWTSCSTYQPLDFSLRYPKANEPEEPKFEQFSRELPSIIAKKCGNSVEIIWDGVPVYYENFKNRKHLEFGDLTGSLIKGTREEIEFTLDKRQRSTGQQQFILLNLLAKQVATPILVEEILEKAMSDRRGRNDVWKAALDVQVNYIKGLYEKDTPLEQVNTLLLDEPDTSMSIKNSAYFWLEYLPALQKATHLQIIVATHSPFAICQKVRDKSNIISVDKKYQEDCLDILQKIKY